MKNFCLLLLNVFLVGIVEMMSTSVKTLQVATGILLPYIEEVPPECIITGDSTQIVVNYKLTSAIIQEDDLYEGSSWIKIPGFGLTRDSQTPSLPILLESFDLPEDCDSAVITITQASYKDYNYAITPSRPPLIDSNDEVYTKFNVKPIISSTLGLPSDIAKITGYESYRGIKRSNVLISPIQYDKNTETVRIYHDFCFRMNFIKRSTPRGLRTRTAFAGIGKFPIDSLIIPDTTYQFKDSANVEIDFSRRPYNIGYAIITTPKYVEAARRFSEYKRRFGYTMKLIIRNEWDASTIKDSLQSFYDNAFNPRYALIIGGHNDVPAEKGKYRTYGYEAYTDYHYACLDESQDETQDIYLGRIPVNTLQEANIVIDKIINYEINPTLSPLFYQTGMHAAFFQMTTASSATDEQKSYESHRFVQTSEEVRNYMLLQGKNVERLYTTDSPHPKYWSKEYSYGEEIPFELQNLNFYNIGWQDIVNSFNSGRFYVLHRDHGSIYGWGNPNFTLNHIDYLTNTNSLPIVFNLNCLSGDFITNGANYPCFAEKLLKSPNGGCAGIIASTGTSYSGDNDVFCHGIFNTLWPEPGLSQTVRRVGNVLIQADKYVNTPSYCLGQILENARNRVHYLYATNTWNDTKERFLLFGDPSMMMRTDTPLEFSDDEVLISSSGITVNCEDSFFIGFQTRSTPGFTMIYHGQNSSITIPSTIALTGFNLCIYGPNRIPKFLEFASLLTETSENSVSISLENNPVRSSANVNYNLPEGTNSAQISIYGLLSGNLVKTYNVDASGNYNIDASNMKSGHYIVNLQTSDGQCAQTRMTVVN